MFILVIHTRYAVVLPPFPPLQDTAGFFSFIRMACVLGRLVCQKSSRVRPEPIDEAVTVTLGTKTIFRGGGRTV